ncbi:hypothetical protein ACA910_019132 [Epithemia clementina (nom. ined.)]
MTRRLFVLLAALWLRSSILWAFRQTARCSLLLYDRSYDHRFNSWNSKRIASLLLWLTFLPIVVTGETLRAAASQTRPSESGTFRYNICNGLSDQLLQHATSISRAIREKYAVVEIPNYFIIHGSPSNEILEKNSTKIVYPTLENSIPLGLVFDAPYLLTSLERQFGIQAHLISFLTDSSSVQRYKMLRCEGIGSIDLEPAKVVQSIIDLFRPSQQYMQPIIDAMLYRFSRADAQDGLPHRDIGVCLHHHANDKDWHDLCTRQSSAVPDDTYRGNCQNEPGQSFLQSVQSRLLKPERSWVYYCGDHLIPSELLDSSINNFTITSRRKLMFSMDSQNDAVGANFKLLQTAILSLANGGGNVASSTNRRLLDMTNASEFGALLDFFVCKTLPIFIGNSISKFSAIQIALRYVPNDDNTMIGQHKAAYWYNSQSIPLQKHWRVFQVPIVYTYTELSANTGKHMLQASIESVRFYMPDNQIHVLYHGHQDTEFRQWLENRGVTIYDHSHPPWQGKIEEMRKNGDPKASHLFLHPGNYFGTWQRIDIPLFLESEYALLLDADTIIRKPFTLTDFGWDLTYGLAMSSEHSPRAKTPINAGITLMNIPHLRRTHSQFLAFILDHVQAGGRFQHPSPSDQGAYLVFYRQSARFLSHYFNMKPYWTFDEEVDLKPSYIIHFHGPKPKEYIEFIMAKPIANKALAPFIRKGADLKSLLCHSLSAFARSSFLVNRTFYCLASFENPAEVEFCQQLFEHLLPSSTPPSPVSILSTVLFRFASDDHQHNCTEFELVIEEALESVPLDLKLPRQNILKRVGLSLKKTSFFQRTIALVLRRFNFFLGIFVCAPVIIIASSGIPRSKRRRRQKRQKSPKRQNSKRWNKRVIFDLMILSLVVSIVSIVFSASSEGFI